MRILVAILAAALSSGGAGVYAQSASSHSDHGAPAAKDDKQVRAHRTTGVVRRVDAKSGTVAIAHEPVKSLGWPSMTMNFRVADTGLLEKLAADRKIDFEFEQRGKDYVITRLK